jgi:hypothetical protein
MLYDSAFTFPFPVTRNKNRIPLIFYGLGLVSLIHIEYTRANELPKHDLNFSQRSRVVSIDNDTNSGKAASILLRLTLKTEWSHAFSATLEMDHVESFFNNDHSNGVIANGKPVIPDVAGTEINQGFVSFKNTILNLKLGRQRINFDDQRFIGGNGFWQNEQTFDALTSRANLATNSSFTYTYLANANRIFGNDAGKYLEDKDINYTETNNKRAGNLLGDHQHHSHLTRIEWNEWDYSQWISYLYLIDNKDLPNASNNTFGTRYSFNYKLDELKYHLHIEAAAQKRTEIPDAKILPYYLTDIGLNISAYEVSARYETLAAKNNIPFITPLGSLHDFQGWADEFLATPTQGIKDASLRFLWRAAPFKIDTRYHAFFGYEDNNKLGKELDIDFVYKPTRKHTLSLRFAYFMPASQSNETNTKKIFMNYAYNM